MHSPFVSNQLRQLIFYNLDNDLPQNALFLAGRFHGLEPRNPDAAHLLALCHFRLGRLKAAYEYSRDKGFRGQHLGCAYVFAQACLGLQRYGDGIGALDRARGFWAGRNHWNKHSEVNRRHTPDAAAINCLLGKLWKGHGDVKKAVEHYVEALKQNPFMWDAFLDLCDTGAAIRTSNLFRLTPEMLAFMSQSSAGASESQTSQGQPLASRNFASLATPGNDPFNPSSRSGSEPGLNLGGSNLLSRLNEAAPQPTIPNGHFEAETPTMNGHHYDEDVLMGDASTHASLTANEPPHAPSRKTRTVNPLNSEPSMRIPKMKIPIESRSKLGSEGPDSSEIPQPAAPVKRTISGHASQASSSSNADPNGGSQRRSARLATANIVNKFNPISSKLTSSLSRDTESKERRETRKAVKATGTRGRTAATSTVGRVVSGNRKLEGPDPNAKESRETRVPKISSATVANSSSAKLPSIDHRAEQEAVQQLLDMFAKIGHGYFCLSRYQCQDAIQIFNTLSREQRDTPWVLAQMAKAHYESQGYSEAEEIFRKIKKLSPSRLEDLEIYSTVLWHLRKETELAYLAHELIEADRLSPEAWCTIGNSFSLQREHDQAVKCFKRATQLDPKFAYAFTLQGHEHVTNEEYEKALLAYRSAVSADNRHYNGWYGLGKVYEKMGKFDVAERHYKAAAQINPTNSVLVVRIGVALEKLKKFDAALAHFTHAVKLDPKSALPRFKRGQVLMKLRMLKEALSELSVLKDIAPDEANVHFMLGKVYKQLRDKGAAIKHFTIALNLDPKAAQYIKEAMESISDDEDDGYDDDNDDL